MESVGDVVAPLAKAESPEDILEGSSGEQQSKPPIVTATASSLQQFTQAPWDPVRCPEWDNQKASVQCLQRIKRDLMILYKDPPHGIFVLPDENQMTLLHALVIGPYDTPYEGGFFYFCIRCPPDYPIRAPRVRLLTTGDDTVRFNPNLYRNGKIYFLVLGVTLLVERFYFNLGKVCLSILGTWSGPSWTPSQSLASVLVSVQSIMNEKPYHNEPGYEKEHSTGDSDRYNAIISHETIRVAVCDMLEGASNAWRKCPDGLKEIMRSSFPQFFEHYKSVCKKQIEGGYQGCQMNDPFGEKRGTHDPKCLLLRLEAITRNLPDDQT